MSSASATLNGTSGAVWTNGVPPGGSERGGADILGATDAGPERAGGPSRYQSAVAGS
jgi:hypothetical protein